MTPTDAYRGAGRPEATYAIERAMDSLATELGLDPLELRSRNYIRKEQFPYTAMTGLVYDSGDHQAAADKARGLANYDALRVEQARRRADGDIKQLGIGVSSYFEMCGTRRAVCWPASTTRPAAGSPPRCACCRRTRCKSSPAPRRTARDTRRRGR